MTAKLFAHVAVALGALCSGCGGSGSEPVPEQTVALSQEQRAVPPTAATAGQEAPPLRTMPAAQAGRTAPIPSSDAAGFAKMKALPLLSPLSERDKATLFKRLATATPSERLPLIDGYASLNALPDRQKEVLLGQLEDIVAPAVPAQQLVCQCGSQVKRELCVRERCSDAVELQSLCNQACGALGALGTQCRAAPACAGR